MSQASPLKGLDAASAMMSDAEALPAAPAKHGGKLLQTASVLERSCRGTLMRAR
jgi:hypothetical protein